MYSVPAALKYYAEYARISEGFAQRLRDEFFTRSMLLPDTITGLKLVMKEAKIRLSRRQVSELVQFPCLYGTAQQDGHGGCFHTSTTLADLLTALLIANPFSTIRASLRRQSSEESEDGVAYSRQGRYVSALTIETLGFSGSRAAPLEARAAHRS
jgi:hypothetical protein